MVMHMHGAVGTASRTSMAWLFLHTSRYYSYKDLTYHRIGNIISQRMEPEQFRTLSELAEEDPVVGKQKIHSLPFEVSDTLRSVYSNDREDDGCTVYFSVAGSRASSMRTEGNGTIKAASFSEGRVSNASEDIQEDDCDGICNSHIDDMADLVITENKGVLDPPCEDTMFPHAFSFSKGAGSPPTVGNTVAHQPHQEKEKDPGGHTKLDCIDAEILESDVDILKEEIALPDNSPDKGVHVRLRSQPLLSEAESVGPVSFSDTTTERVELHLPTPIHEEQKSCEMSPERTKDASPCRLCSEKEEQICVLEKRLEQMKQDVSEAYVEVSRYKQQISDMQQEQISARDNHLEQLQEEMRYLQVIHTEEISALCAENGMLRQQLQDSSYRDEYPQYDYRSDYEAPRPQRTRDTVRKPRKIILPAEESGHSDSPDQIGYSPLGAARIQFK